MDDGEKLPERLQQLHDLLLEISPDGSINLGRLDGFLCGVAVAPEVINPLDWLPYVTSEAQEAGIDHDRLALLLDLALERHDNILTDLALNAYRPVYPFDEREELLWELWLQGFALSMDLCRKAWEKLIKKGRNPEAQEALGAVISLFALAEGEGDPDDPEVKSLAEAAPDLIPEIAGAFYRAHVAGPAAPLVRDTHVGRNDPCPCGSGKKYKRCCGAG